MTTNQTQNRIKIFDTTLRDGEQSPGVSLSVQEKVIIAKQLEKLGVDIIEAGFPVSSQGSFDAVQQIAREVKIPIICGLARCSKKDIDAAWDALKEATHPRIHVFVATSSIHLEHKLKKSQEEILAMVREHVTYARSLCKDIEFSPEDASRSDMDFMCKVIKTAIACGATTINVPDTVGYAQPEEFGERFRYIHNHIPTIAGITLSAHCHNDLGLAVANSLAAVRNGATQIEGTINGIGERAGNTALEEVVMAIRTRSDFYGVHTSINTNELFKTSKLVEKITGLSVQRSKAIVGKNAFAHESGIHQHGILSYKKTYEIMAPEDIGWEGDTFVIGKLSGKHAIDATLKEAGITLTPTQLESVVQKVKTLADKQKTVAKEDVVAIAVDALGMASVKEDAVILEDLSVLTGKNITPTSTVGLLINGEKKVGVATGLGPVDAASKAIRSVIGPFINLKEYNLRAITGGTDALASVAITFEDHKNRSFSSEAVDEDVIMASVKAMIKGVNKAMAAHAQQGDHH
ncbi:2-isopropylmalate synthase [Candidatus Woesearchaeota archaeon]|nr:2-isopropylmalate synthase [Candidatus Woesearchaeota archaeon]